MTDGQPLGHPPAFLRGADRATRPLRPVFHGRRPTGEELAERAVRASGLSDFGPGAVVEPLDELIAPVFDDPSVTAIGLGAWPRILQDLLVSRLRIVDWYRTHPEIADERLVRPIIVTGMPRTGTTLLYNLLASMPGARPLLGWESMDPLPHHRLALRKARYRGWVAGVNRLIPDLKQIHTLQPDGPDEGLELMDRTLHSYNFMLYNWPYVDWLLERSQAELDAAWQLWHWQLQMLQAERPGGYWVLKAPTFMGLFPTIDALVPDARWVMTHRDLHSAIPSAMSLVTVVQKALREPGTTIELDRVVDRLADQANETRKHIEQRPNVQVLYPEFIADPGRTVRQILEAFDEEVPADLDDRVARHLQEHPQGKHGPHRYSIEQFGLERDDLEPYAADYARDLGLDRFGADRFGRGDQPSWD